MSAVARQRTRLVIRRARPADLDAIWPIEQVSFPTPWSLGLLSSELARDDALYLAATVEGRLIGYVGLWHAADEGHVCTLAVHPDWRGHGVGEALMLCALEQAAALGADFVGLEYRVSNVAAEKLYTKLGFVAAGRRRRYYQDTGEDAVVAVVSGLQDEQVRMGLARARERWEQERDLELVIDL